MIKIKQKLVSNTIAMRRSYGKGNKKKFIIVHQTGNTSKGANAEMHSRLQSNLNPRKGSWHIQVDDKEAIQSFDYDYNCWHAGVGRALGNLDTIGVESCINSDGDYLKTLENTAEVVRYLMDKFDIPIENVTQHYDWSKKDCPKQIRAGKDGITWKKFLNMVKEDKKEVEVKQSDDHLYRVQVGAFSNKENAERLAKELKDKGYPVFIPKASEVTATTDQKVKPSSTVKEPVKSIEELAREVLANKHGDGQERKDSLGENYSKVQARVEQILEENRRKAVEDIAREILYTKHKWGNGATRKERLRKAGYDPTEVQKVINRLA